eukprot:scaffold587418_cov50-Prasinocladus_malaysianus.AAC.1
MDDRPRLRGGRQEVVESVPAWPAAVVMPKTMKAANSVCSPSSANTIPPQLVGLTRSLSLNAIGNDAYEDTSLAGSSATTHRSSD